jgi:hypothetical protein
MANDFVNKSYAYIVTGQTFILLQEEFTDLYNNVQCFNFGTNNKYTNPSEKLKHLCRLWSLNHRTESNVSYLYSSLSAGSTIG